MQPTSFTIRDIKSFLNRLSVLIRIGKQLRKMEKNQHLENFDPEEIKVASQQNVQALRYMARHYHVAYSEFRGHTREQIESKVSDQTKRQTDENLILHIHQKMIEALPLQAELVTSEVPANAS